MRNGYVLRPVDSVESVDKHLSIFWDHADAFRKDWPDGVYPVMEGPGDLVLLRIAGHFELCRHRENGLRPQHRLQPVRQPFLSRCIEAIIKIVCQRQTPVMEQNGERLCPQVPQSAGVPRHAFLDPRFAGPGMALRPDTDTALADSKGQAIGAAKTMMMAGAAGDIPVPGQNLVIEQQLSDLGASRRKAMIICVCQRIRQR